MLLLRKKPGMTVSELAAELDRTPMGVRRHLESLSSDGLAESVPAARRGVGRPPSGWRLTRAGLEHFPRRYDGLALDLLEDALEEGGAELVDTLLARRTDKLVDQYQAKLAASDDVPERVCELARIRDDAGYVADAHQDDDGAMVLTENNCAVHRVAERHPQVCAMELSLLRRVLGPDVEVTRLSHAMSGDAVCSYRIRPVVEKDSRRQRP